MPIDSSLELLKIAAEAALDKKAFNLVALEVGTLTSYADHILLCSAASERQVGAIADSMIRGLRAAGRRPLYPENNLRNSGWVLLDYGDTILHIFTEEKRQYFGLDNLWGDAPRVDSCDLGLVEPPSPTGD